MMTKQKSPFHNRWKYLATLPVVFILGLFLCCTIVKSQDPVKPAVKENEKKIVVEKPTAETPPEKIYVESNAVENEPAYVFVDVQAKFQDGNIESFRNWVQNAIVYPEIAKQNGIFGRVTAQFSVDAHGKVCDVKLLRSVDPSLDNEAVRVINASPDWTPASQGGKNVKQQFVIPVVFSQGEKASTINQQNGDTEPAYVFVDEQALFQGGTLDVFREWVQKQLVYPDEAKKQGIFGRITIQFAVNSEGKVCDIKIIRGVHPSLDTETMRVVGQSPVWTPAKQGGKKVKQLFVIPVIFQLQK